MSNLLEVDMGFRFLAFLAVHNSYKDSGRGHADTRRPARA